MKSTVGLIQNPEQFSPSGRVSAFATTKSEKSSN